MEEDEILKRELNDSDFEGSPRQIYESLGVDCSKTNGNTKTETINL